MDSKESTKERSFFKKCRYYSGKEIVDGETHLNTVQGFSVNSRREGPPREN